MPQWVFRGWDACLAENPSDLVGFLAAGGDKAAASSLSLLPWEKGNHEDRSEAFKAKVLNNKKVGRLKLL